MSKIKVGSEVEILAGPETDVMVAWLAKHCRRGEVKYINAHGLAWVEFLNGIGSHVPVANLRPYVAGEIVSM
jgi:hypothetical protein